jgi:predicted amidohydrolase YtcJ
VAAASAQRTGGRWRAGWLAGALVAGVAGGADAPAGPPATLVWANARVYTMDAAGSRASAIAFGRDQILAVGDAASVAPWIGRATRVVDMHGRMVLPGFIDAHTHPVYGAGNALYCDLHSENLAEPELVRAGKHCLAQLSSKREQGWMQVVGVSAIGVAIDRHVVDRISERLPIVLWGEEGHTAWANTPALAASGVTAATPDPVGGRIGRVTGGEPDGLFMDKAMDLIAAPALPLDVVLPEVRKILAQMSAAGITAIQDADAGEREIAAYARLEREGALRQRVRLAQHIEPVLDAQALARVLQVAARFQGDPLIRADAVKIFLDGTLEYPYQTAALIEPYLNADGTPTTRDGGSYYRKEDLDRVVAAVDHAGLGIHVHAIGDRAARDVIDAFEAAARQNGTRDMRHQIAHLELIADADVLRMARDGVIANVQLFWAQPDVWAVEGTLPYIGAQRHAHLYRGRSLKDAGVPMAGGSDWPVSTFEPLQAIQQGVTRGAFPGLTPANASRRMQVLNADERLDVETMIALYTSQAARALRLEQRTGSLEVGKRADAVVLARDITQIDPASIGRVPVVCTLFDGAVVHGKAADCGP